MDWLTEFKETFRQAQRIDWNDHVRSLNSTIVKEDGAQFSTSLQGLPLWFQGDVEGLKPRKWALLISLNPQVHPDGALVVSDPWEYCRNRYRLGAYNRRFIGRLVRIASGALGIPSADPGEFAHRHTVLVQLCPYASREFRLSPDQMQQLSESDIGFRLSHALTSILIEEAAPGIVIINGNPTLSNFDRLYKPELVLKEYPSVSGNRTLWHKEGWLKMYSERVPVIAFPFLGKPTTHLANADIDHLSQFARRLVLKQEQPGWL